jgi:putative tryptophan/tyrosine transport system substrate-binding protein
MKRRTFITLLGSAAAWPLAARAQQRPIPVIGFLGPTSSTGYAPYVAAFRQGLGAGGFIDGKDVAIEYRWADDQPDRLPTLAAELVRRPVAIIATVGATAAALAAKQATTTIPIVFAVGADPVKLGLVASMNRPGGNVTGVSFLSNALGAKRLELLCELVPSAAVIGVLANPSNPNALSDVRDVEAAAISLGRSVEIVQAGAERDLDVALAGLVERRVAALLVLPDALFLGRPQRIADLVARHNLPAMYSNRVYTEVGGLMSYGSVPTEAFREARIYTARILKGEKPSDLPVVQSIKFELVINLQTAKALGLNVPAKLLALADGVIE